MQLEKTEVYCGTGHGKTSLAFGRCLCAGAEHKSVIIIHFLKGKEKRSLDILQDVPGLDIKIFSFEKKYACYAELKEEEKLEEKRNILNALNFARKVVVTQECDVLVLDEILGLVDSGITTSESICDILKHKSETMNIIMTGRVLPEGLRSCVDSITTITTEDLRNDSDVI